MICHRARSIDDLLHEALEQLTKNGEGINPSRGAAVEVRGVRLELTDPRARLSRSHKRGKVFSCLGELVWYLAGSGSVDHIAFYLNRYQDEAEADGTVNGAYGTRLFAGERRLQRAIETLLDKGDSRQAVVPLLDAADLANGYRHIPCTAALQFMLRNRCVDMVVFMRSNDAYLGLSHDIFAFTMIQELVARALGADLGTYVHMAGSLHLYDEHRANADEYLREGFTAFHPMPPMPPGNPWDAVGRLTAAEQALRAGERIDPDSVGAPYWADLVRLLNMFVLSKESGANGARIAELRRSMHSRVFDVFLNDKFGLLGL